ncbi:hypothetical protein SISNIDRAFT_527310 [Sistotremastrum niveocremeum HHB9708]|uniref:F-box domain-containing protein n=1 Tax=Sistotremastrum niveocremeum HHB9708 TaxID=1314777 RepID=A0A164Q6S2_9AGAM|nr:hypothetical protein SISNIDRAFT_527310 [Sistotremastrum niveocremeum HHB9708]
MDAVFSIPYLIGLTFEYCLQADLARCARVSRSLSEPALDALYRVVRDPVVLLRFLASLEYESDTWNFKHKINATDWQRFQLYARRVRVLTYDARTNGVISPGVWNDIALTRPPSVICPGLHTLEWRVGHASQLSQYSLLFIHEGLTSLEIGGWNEPARLFRGISYTAPNLRKLSIHLLDHARLADDSADEPELISLIKGASRLEQVELPLPLFTTQILNALSTSPSLARLLRSKRTRTSILNTPLQKSNFPGGSFQSLQHMDLVIDLHMLCSPSTSRWSLPTLASLDCIARINGSPALVGKSIKAIAQTFPALKALKMNIIDGRDVFQEPSDVDALRPFMALRKMRSFTFYAPNGLMMETVNEREITDLAKAWPYLEDFEIGCTDCAPDDEHAYFSPLTVAAIFPFAEHCPLLRSLHLHVRPDIPPSRPPLDSTQFKRTFSTLTLGCSTLQVSDCAQFASIISGLVAPGVSVGCCDDLWRRGPPEIRGPWKEFKRLLPIFVAARHEEKMRASSLAQSAVSQELEALRAVILRNGLSLPAVI